MSNKIKYKDLNGWMKFLFIYISVEVIFTILISTGFVLSVLYKLIFR